MFRKKKVKAENIEIGSTVSYVINGETLEGIVHGVRKSDVNGKETIVGYLIDNGETHLENEFVTDGNEENVKVSQPVLIDVTPENIKLVE